MAKKANTPKPTKPPGKASKHAANASGPEGQKITRETTNTREEVREQNNRRQGYSK